MMQLLHPASVFGAVYSYGPEDVEDIRVDIGRCVRDAGKRYGIEPSLLWKLIRVESDGYVSSIRSGDVDYKRLPLSEAVRVVRWLYRSGRRIDIGLMQVNTVNMSDLGIRNPELLLEPCYNVRAGAYLLHRAIRKLGYNWNAVAAYNTGIAGLFGKSVDGKKRVKRGIRYAKMVSASSGKPFKVHMLRVRSDVHSSEMSGGTEGSGFFLEEAVYSEDR